MTSPLRWDPEDPKSSRGGFLYSAASAPQISAYSTLVLFVQRSTNNP